jgi:hypothetical protein
MLPESDVLLNIQTNFFEVEENPGDKITQSFVINNSLFDCFTDLYPLKVLHLLLMHSTIEWQLDMRNIFEFGMTFILRINKVLNLCHLELSHSNQTVSRSNLIPEAETDLSSCKRKTTAIELS